MSPFIAFVMAVFGALCIWWLLARARKQGGNPRPVAWVALLIWYVAVMMGLSFTMLNADGGHNRATWVGGVATIVVAVVLGFVVYRFSSLPTSRRSA